ncbi:MAG: PD-(D/E)XK nuclease family protein [Elusimicrobiota bacterium]|jgi:putative RecB family exonuclease|nr:PD-(D/E)XK nuclease family protein [Elusimicrobiota bacterium]
MASALSFSYSKLGLYKECPQKYKFRYIDKIPERQKYYFAFGTALHKVMEYLYAAPAFPPLETTLKFFKSDWDSTSFEAKGYASQLKEQEGYQEGVRIIKAYYAKHEAEKLNPLSTEMRTTVQIDGLSVISIIDRIDYLGQGQVSILDYKTGKTLSREPDQLMMYQKVMDNNPKLSELVLARDPSAKNIQVASMLFYHLPTLKAQSFQPASKEEIGDFWAGVLQVATNIKAAKFAPDPGETKCRWCDYKPMCPVWQLSPSELSKQEAEPAPLPKEQAAPLTPTEELTQKVDAYGKALEQVETLGKEIKTLMKENNFNLHFGKHYQAELEKINKIEFKDQEKTVETLKELNLLPKVLRPTLSALQTLLTNGSLTAEEQKKLNSLATKVESLKLICKKIGD